MIRPFRSALDFDEAVIRYTQARLAWEDAWGPDGADALLHRLLTVAERLWSFLRPPAPAVPVPPGALPPQVIEALSNPTIARLLSSPRGALALARLIEREEQRLARAPRPVDDPLSGLARARAAETGPVVGTGELRPARPARFARARPLRDYEQERGGHEEPEREEPEREELEEQEPEGCAWTPPALVPARPVARGGAPELDGRVEAPRVEDEHGEAHGERGPDPAPAPELPATPTAEPMADGGTP